MSRKQLVEAMMALGRKRRAGKWLATLAVMAAACGEDPTGPAADPSDVERTREEFAVLRAELFANTDLAPDVARVRGAVDTLGVPLPADLLGSTLEWDEVAGGYVDAAAAGAPADGLRFLLYDPAGTPPSGGGFVDVRDVSDATRPALDVRLEKDGATRLEYALELDTPESRTVTAAGHVSSGTRRLDFDVAQVTSAVEDGFRIDLDYTFSMADRPLAMTVDFALNLSLFAPSTRFIASFVDADDALVIDFVQLTDSSIDGEVRWNDERIMLVTDDGGGQAVFLGPAGETLDPAEARAIEGLLDLALGGLGELLPYLIFPAEPLA